MRIVFISDTHTQHRFVTPHLPQGDTIVHAGDISGRGSKTDVKDFLMWFNDLPYDNKIFIAGNHDFLFEDSPTIAKELLDPYPNIIYLEDSEVVIDGVKFYGSPVTPRFFNWAFNEDRGERIREYWLKIPLDTDVLITHGPPHGVLDYTIHDQKHVGCEELMDVIATQLDLKVHVFGHIHEGSGIAEINNTKFINASVLNHRYDYVNLPHVLDV